MKTYTVISAAGVTISSGILLLDEIQGNARAQALTDLGEGLYEVRQPVQLKCGEVFGYDGEVNKALLEEIQPVAKDKKPGKRSK